MEQALDVTELCVSARDRPLVSGVTLSCARGERVAVVGASGSGKSLTAKALLGMLPPGLTASGSVRIDGAEVLGVPCAQRRPEHRPAAVLQDSSLALHPLITVGRQVALPMRRTGARRTVLDLLAAVGLPEPDRIAARLPGQLSGGQRQRVCLALALACSPRLLIADEPTTALDMVTQAAIVRLLAERTGGPGHPALLFVTHDLAVAAELCSRIVVLHGGAVVEDRPSRELLRAPRHDRTRALVDAARAASDVLAAHR